MDLWPIPSMMNDGQVISRCEDVLVDDQGSRLRTTDSNGGLSIFRCLGRIKKGNDYGKYKNRNHIILIQEPYISMESWILKEQSVLAAERLGAEGYEIVAAQSIPSYPFVSDEFLARVPASLKTLMAHRPHLLYPANMDCGMLKDRDLTGG